MTNREALEVIERFGVDSRGYPKLKEALGMAIEALKETDMGLNNGDHLHPFGEPFGWTEEEIQKHGLRELLKEVSGNIQPEKSTTAQKSQLAEEKSTCDLISRQDAIDAIDKHIDTFDAIDANYLDGLRAAMSLLNDLPSAQPERKKGNWILVNGKTSVNCSYCYHCSWSLSFEDTVRQFNFCPNCGAEMRGEQDDS